MPRGHRTVFGIDALSPIPGYEEEWDSAACQQIRNPIAVKFVVIEPELGNKKDVVQSDDHLLQDELLERMGIEILDVSRTTDSDEPKPYNHRT